MHFIKKSTNQHVPWNKGKLTGEKPPLQLKHVWAIRTTLQLDGRLRDLALFNIAIDRKLRGCDVVNRAETCYVSSDREPVALFTHWAGLDTASVPFFGISALGGDSSKGVSHENSGQRRQ